METFKHLMLFSFLLTFLERDPFLKNCLFSHEVLTGTHFHMKPNKIMITIPKGFMWD